jgi:hypothetical protein
VLLNLYKIKKLQGGDMMFKTYPKDERHETGGRTVRVYDKSGWIGTFKSITKASKALNLDRVVIGRVLDSDKEYKGYKFKSVTTSPRA